MPLHIIRLNLLRTFPQPEIVRNNNFLWKLHLLDGNFWSFSIFTLFNYYKQNRFFYRRERKLHLLYEIFSGLNNFTFFNYNKQYRLLYIRDGKGNLVLENSKQKLHTVYKVLTNGKKSAKLLIVTFAHCSTCCLFYSSHSLGPRT